MFWIWANTARVYAPYVVWPLSAVIGFIGYNVEWKIRGNKETPYKAISIAEERDQRHLEECQTKDPTKIDSLELKNFQPKTIFEKTSNHSGKVDKLNS